MAKEFLLAVVLWSLCCMAIIYVVFEPVFWEMFRREDEETEEEQ